MEQAVLTNEQYKDLSKRIVHAIAWKYRIVPVNSLRHPKYRLEKPIFISLEFDNDQVIASFDDIEAFSYADSESEAISLLCEEIVMIFEDLKQDKDNLGPLPAKWLQYLEDIIICR